ncbi:hypothetical protein [Neisseria cinerea]|uniref:Uncharacterized protein n=1 Tax=Neisseria cinerea TaxID=483 RepID=A0A7T3BKH1_NEICI|nr:hypothetical protein [Neisseria cinerea]QPT37396.1 hypothetical protein I6G28_05475 [Neisseria cinerea]
MPSERISDGILCWKIRIMTGFLPEYKPCGIYLGSDWVSDGIHSGFHRLMLSET